MFGISFGEIIIILVGALIILGPQKISQLVIQTTKLLIKMKSYFETMRGEIYKQTGINELSSLKNELDELYKKLEYHYDKPTANDSVCYDSREYTLAYFQPELDFEREPELFDDLTYYESRNSKTFN